jgi:hypothetical protein
MTGRLRIRAAGVGGLSILVVLASALAYRQHLARERLTTIVRNLADIDDGVSQACMEMSDAWKLRISRDALTAVGGRSLPHVDWPTGPVPGTYRVTTCEAPSTFDGGNSGDLNRLDWRSMCTSDPMGCGL